MSGFDLDRLASEIASVLDPLVSGLENPGLLDLFLREIGLRGGPDATLAQSLATIAGFADQCRKLAGQSSPSFAAVAALLEQSRQAFAAAWRLADSGGVAPGATALGADLAELLVVSWLARRHPVTRAVAILLGLIQRAEEQPLSAPRKNGDQLIRAGFSMDRLHPGRLVDLVTDPLAALKAEYASPMATDADAAALAGKLFPRLQILLDRLGVVSQYGLHPDDVTFLGDWGGAMSHALVIYVDSVDQDADADAGVVLTLSPASQGDLGLVISPFGALSFTRPLLGWNVTSKVSAGVDVVSWGKNGVQLLPSAGASAAELAVAVDAVRVPPEDGSPAVVFGAPDSTRLELGGVELKAEAHLSKTRRTVALEADISKSAIVLAGGDGDGFTSSLMPSGGLRGEFDLGLGWATGQGLSLRGSAGLEANFPVGRSIAGVTLAAVHTALRAQNGRLDGELSASFSASIGPVEATVERIGLAAALTFPPNGGNLGFADLSLGLKSPTGAGLAIDAHGVLSGGGFLSLDPASGNYGGVVQLTLHDKISLSGYGLIATKMPDGGPGFSLLVFITSDGFEPIPLGFGFMLQGIGGMLGIHRTFDQQVLRAGLKSDTLATLLFPRDPVGNAPALLTALSAAFPVREGSYLVGILAEITWFTPTLVSLNLALILELGARTRLLALGRVSALLPSRDNDLIRINLDSIGVLDFDEGTFEADAVLIDSRIAHQFPVTGSAALRARWSSGATFVLAVGGLNPHFAPPAGFPALERVAIALCSGRNPRLVCSAYFAITSNTVQFGANASLYAEAAGFSISGDLGFDALVTIDPPHFIVDFHASVQLKHGSWNLFKVSLDGTLEGPVPLRIAAKATIEILFFSVSVHFDYTLVGGNAGQSVPSIRLEDKVRAALADPSNWSTQSGLSHGVALRNLPSSGGPVLDPLGQLIVQQQVAPLNTRRPVDTFGGQRVDGPQQFVLAGSFDGHPGTAVSGAFAPARYFSMKDDERLTAPSFETMDAGIVLGDPNVTFDPTAISGSALDYDQHVLNPAGSAASPLATYHMSADSLKPHLTTGAAARAPLRQVGRQRFLNPDAKPAATLNPVRWRAVPTYGAGPAPLAAAKAPATWSETQATVEAMRAGDRWVAVPSHELAA